MTVRASASQLESLRRCEFYWLLKHALGIPAPQSPGAAIGDAIHKHAEALLEGREPPPEPVLFRAQGKRVAPGVITRCAEELVALLRAELPHGTVEGVEEWFTVRLYGVEFWGKVDALIRDAGKFVVVDFKTTSGIQWAKDESALVQDVQANLYALMVLDDGEQDDVELVWLTVETQDRPKAPRVARVLRNQEDALEYLNTAGFKESCERLVELSSEYDKPVELRLHKHARKATDISRFTQACKAFGGCPYLEVCRSGKYDAVAKGVSMPTLEEILMQKKAAKAAAKAAEQQTEQQPAQAVNPPVSPVYAAAKAAAPEPEPALAAEPEPAPEPEPKKRGRKPKQAPAPQPGLSSEPVDASAEETDITMLVVPKRKAAPIGMLYVNCVFCKEGVAIDLEEYLQPIIDEILGKLGLESLYVSKYNEAWGHLQQALQLALQGGDLPHAGAVALSTRSKLGEIAEPFLSKAAYSIIRGAL